MFSTIEPTVIEEEILRKAVNEQVSTDIADIARREGIEFNTVNSLRLDFKSISLLTTDILKIDNLWAFENLVKLQLDNNIIERIENIHLLVNLQWLDLSFNNISVIEGLDGLFKLTDLTLYNNRISKIEGLDDLVNLNVLSIGNNNLTILEEVSYLCKFDHLKVFNAAGNAIAKNPNYRNYTLAHLRKLKYLDYRLVDKESVDLARSTYIDVLIALEEEEKVSNTKKEENAINKQKNLLFENAHINGLDNLFDNLFLEDADFQKIFPIGKLAIIEQREEYRFRCEPVIQELSKFVLNKHKEQFDDITQFQKCKQDACSSHDSTCIEMINEYQHVKKQLFRTIHANKEVDIDDCIRKLKENTADLSDFLISHEMQLVEQFEEVIKEFERSYTELSSGINEVASNCFSRLRELETEYHERFTELVLACFDRFNKGDMDDVPDELRDLMSDKDALLNALNASHDFRLARYDHQEDTLVTGSAKNTESVVTNSHEDEAKRNRTRLCAIITFLDKCQSEIEQIDDEI